MNIIEQPEWRFYHIYLQDIDNSLTVFEKIYIEVEQSVFRFVASQVMENTE